MYSTRCLLLVAYIEGFYELVVCGSPVSSKSIGSIFPTAFVHVANSHTISSDFMIIIFAMVTWDQ